MKLLYDCHETRYVWSNFHIIVKKQVMSSLLLLMIATFNSETLLQITNSQIHIFSLNQNLFIYKLQKLKFLGA